MAVWPAPGGFLLFGNSMMATTSAGSPRASPDSTKTTIRSNADFGEVMFDDVIGLQPEDAARWSALVEQCRPILENDGMEAVQAFLAKRDVSIIQSIVITRALLGNATTPLRTAIDVVTTSTARK